MRDNLHIAIDFDGTIVEHKYPAIGNEIPGAFETLKKLNMAGYKLILWTYRDGEELQQAVDFCLKNGVIFWAVNQSYPEEQHNKYLSRKIDADIFIDDKNFNGFPGWDKIAEELLEESPPITENHKDQKKKKGWFKF